MKHTKEPWGYACYQITDERDIVIAEEVGVADCKRITTCVNALSGIFNPASYIKAAEHLMNTVLSGGGDQAIAEAALDMKAVKGKTDEM